MQTLITPAILGELGEFFSRFAPVACCTYLVLFIKYTSEIVCVKALLNGTLAIQETHSMKPYIAAHVLWPCSTGNVSVSVRRNDNETLPYRPQHRTPVDPITHVRLATS